MRFPGQVNWDLPSFNERSRHGSSSAAGRIRPSGATRHHRFEQLPASDKVVAVLAENFQCDGVVVTGLPERRGDLIEANGPLSKGQVIVPLPETIGPAMVAAPNW